VWLMHVALHLTSHVLRPRVGKFGFEV